MIPIFALSDGDVGLGLALGLALGLGLGPNCLGSTRWNHVFVVADILVTLAAVVLSSWYFLMDFSWIPRGLLVDTWSWGASAPKKVEAVSLERLLCELLSGSPRGPENGPLVFHFCPNEVIGQIRSLGLQFDIFIRLALLQWQLCLLEFGTQPYR